MDCREIQELLPEYTAEALSRQQMRRVQEHLDGCAACAGELARLGSAMRLVERWGGVDPPPGIWDAVCRQIETESHSERRGRSLRSWWTGLFTPPARARLAPAALGGLALFAVFWSLRPAASPTPPESVLRRQITSIPVLAKEPEMVAAVQQHSLASAGLFLADRAGLESMVQIVRRHGDVP